MGKTEIYIIDNEDGTRDLEIKYAGDDFSTVYSNITVKSAMFDTTDGADKWKNSLEVEL